MNSSRGKTYTIVEYGGFVRGGVSSGKLLSLPGKNFDTLRDFIFANKRESADGITELLSYSMDKRHRECIKARNYVGLIALDDGTSIEILPKIHDKETPDQETKSIFLEMLKTLKDCPFKKFNMASLAVERMTMLDIFITMFVREAMALVKQGLKSSYVPVSNNERFFKGKLDVQRNIKHNLFRRDRFHVRYKLWSLNCPENRLMKSTLALLRKLSGDDQNKLRISMLLSNLDGVDLSNNYDADFSLCAGDRSSSHYQRALSWCRLFLRHYTFTPFAGHGVALALLFPMEKVFESYVAERLRRVLPPGATIRTQDGRFFLFHKLGGGGIFRIRPDIVIERPTEHGPATVVLDTKWKVLSSNPNENYRISQADMYQMYAYGHKYRAEKVALVYPLAGTAPSPAPAFTSRDGVNVEVSLFDLRDRAGSLHNLLQLAGLAG